MDTKIQVDGELLAHIKKLEAARKISLAHKLLLAERGTVEDLLRIITGHDVRVDVVRQGDLRSDDFREIVIRDTTTGAQLIAARTKVFVENLRPEIKKDLEARKLGIGAILAKHRVETRREIKEIGYKADRAEVYRVYHILAGGKPIFEITEFFPENLPTQV